MSQRCTKRVAFISSHGSLEKVALWPCYQKAHINIISTIYKMKYFLYISAALHERKSSELREYINLILWEVIPSCMLFNHSHIRLLAARPEGLSHALKASPPKAQNLSCAVLLQSALSLRISMAVLFLKYIMFACRRKKRFSESYNSQHAQYHREGKLSIGLKLLFRRVRRKSFRSNNKFTFNLVPDQKRGLNHDYKNLYTWAWTFRSPTYCEEQSFF